MAFEQSSENTAGAAVNSDRGTVNLVYILYIVGFFIPITALVGAIVAYVNRSEAASPYREHFRFQVKIFIRGLIFAIALVFGQTVAAAIGVLTGGLGFLLTPILIAIGLWWLVWTIMAIARGFGALGRQQPAPA